MAKKLATLQLNVGFTVEERDGYFAAKSKPFAVTVYGKTADEAEKKAVNAVGMLLENYSQKTLDEFSGFLKRRGAKYNISEKPLNKPRLVRECKQEMRLKVSASA